MFENLKNCFLFIFLMHRTFYMDVIFLFIMFQKANSLTTMNVKKDKYNEIERNVYDSLKFSCWLLLCMYLFLTLVSIVPNQLVTSCTIILSVVLNTSLLMIMSNHNFSTSFYLNRVMYANHRYEYERHVCQGVSLYFSTYISMTLLLAMSLFFLAIGSCKFLTNHSPGDPSG